MISSNGTSKVRPEHLARRALVYLRQSSMQQVRDNVESQRLQYALATRARELGWADVTVVDEDLGQSAGMGARKRPGFEALISQVALGEVGIVMSREVSRLSRTDRDWCRLLEVCQVFGTLIADEQQIYDLDQMDDQLVLGIKGTLSVVELKVLKMRMDAGKRSAAARGEYRMRLPAGYLYDLDGRPIKDPDERTQEAISLVFAQFRRLRVGRQVHEWFVENAMELPSLQYINGSLKKTWKIPQLLQVANILKNPFYAGAYTYGRRPVERVLVDGRVVKRKGALRQAEDSEVFIRDHHEGYIDWSTYEENRAIMRDNRARLMGSESKTSPRRGTALLVGILRCGRCGRKLHVHYWSPRGAPRYMCKGDYGDGGNYCVSVSGTRIEGRVANEVLRVVSPDGVDASLLAIERLENEGAEQRRALQLKVEQLEYEARRAFEQYDSVDPRNRLVAAGLERRWNEKLEETEAARAALEDEAARRQVPNEELYRRICDLGANFSDVWNSAACPPVVKKNILRTVLNEILLTKTDNSIEMVLHWAGGVHTRLVVPRSPNGARRRTSEEALDIIRKLAPSYDDVLIASVLNRNAFTTSTGLRWTVGRVRAIRSRYRIAGGRSLELEGVLNPQGGVRLLRSQQHDDHAAHRSRTGPQHADRSASAVRDLEGRSRLGARTDHPAPSRQDAKARPDWGCGGFSATPVREITRR